MNREILFRAKRRDNGEWVEGYVIQRYGAWFIYDIKNADTCIQNGYLVDSDTICQYTGLTDKKGKGSVEGRELTEQEWKQLKPFANLVARTETGFTEPQFVIDRLNITNNAGECNPMGIAIFANAIDTLKNWTRSLIPTAMSSIWEEKESLSLRKC